MEDSQRVSFRAKSGRVLKTQVVLQLCRFPVPVIPFVQRTAGFSPETSDQAQAVTSIWRDTLLKSVLASCNTGTAD
jgi:hypothetical protein